MLCLSAKDMHTPRCSLSDVLRSLCSTSLSRTCAHLECSPGDVLRWLESLLMSVVCCLTSLLVLQYGYHRLPSGSFKIGDEPLSLGPSIILITACSSLHFFQYLMLSIISPLSVLLHLQQPCPYLQILWPHNTCICSLRSQKLPLPTPSSWTDSESIIWDFSFSIIILGRKNGPN